MTASKSFHQLKKAVPHLYQTVSAGLDQTEECLQNTLQSDNPRITEAARHLLAGGGKRLRPALLLLCAEAVNRAESNPVPAAAAVEIIHMASLVHDDIIDDAPLRRGKTTIHKKWNRETALYTGNFMVCKGLELASTYENSKIGDIALATAAAMCKGEFAQQDTAYTAHCDEQSYYTRIGGKTANLIAAACEIGAYIGGANDDAAEIFRRYGYDLGMAFQITDDILDYTSESEFGKKRGTDLKEGNITLPLIYALKNGLNESRLRQCLNHGGNNRRELDEIILAVTQYGGTEQAKITAAEYIQKAKAELAAIPPLAYKECFCEAADFILQRQL